MIENLRHHHKIIGETEEIPMTRIRIFMRVVKEIEIHHERNHLVGGRIMITKIMVTIHENHLSGNYDPMMRMLTKM